MKHFENMSNRWSFFRQQRFQTHRARRHWRWCRNPKIIAQKLCKLTKLTLTNLAPQQNPKRRGASSRGGRASCFFHTFTHALRIRDHTICSHDAAGAESSPTVGVGKLMILVPAQLNRISETHWRTCKLAFGRGHKLTLTSAGGWGRPKMDQTAGG